LSITDVVTITFIIREFGAVVGGGRGVRTNKKFCDTAIYRIGM